MGITQSSSSSLRTSVSATLIGQNVSVFRSKGPEPKNLVSSGLNRSSLPVASRREENAAGNSISSNASNIVKLEKSPLKSHVNHPPPCEREIEILDKPQESAVAVKQEHGRSPATIAAAAGPLEITPLKPKQEVRKEGEPPPLATVWAAEEMELSNEDRPR